MGKKRTRAMDEEAKRARRDAILSAALDLLEQTEDYDAVTMASVARASQLAKGTLYLYFDTKEELFLHLLHAQFTEWFTALSSTLGALPSPSTPLDVASVIATSISEREQLLMLMTRLHETIETNIATETITMFKRRMRDALFPMAELLEQKLEQLEPGDGFRLLLRTNALILGIHQLANPVPAAQKALEAIDLAVFRVDFEEELRDAIVAQLYGWTKARAVAR